MLAGRCIDKGLINNGRESFLVLVPLVIGWESDCSGWELRDCNAYSASSVHFEGHYEFTEGGGKNGPLLPVTSGAIKGGHDSGRLLELKAQFLVLRACGIE